MMRRISFGAKWLDRMEGLIISSSTSIFVKGSPTKDFRASSGLRQGDRLSPFLFLLVAKGLAGKIAKAKSKGEYQEFSVYNNTQFDLLQFVNDTILIGDGSWKNLWRIKALFRGFELVRGL
ncbi:uncharacterized mitochondrial protein AtMg01250-like [Vicia villosa]|uniref:uncharacterized mitochondrial protein AtMg01250-like n=1 Tax=Vicia villosa TaxID=3911 RepID=UPI00273BAEEA|nr:uncharacterized mitochondrial protein AtMg01250-like [Vicia villosa]